MASIDHDFDGHGGCDADCRLCRAERAEALLTAQAQAIKTLQAERDGWHHRFLAMCEEMLAVQEKLDVAKAARVSRAEKGSK